MKAEARFILAAITSCRENSNEELRDAALAVDDWETVAQLAIRHRVGGFVKGALVNVRPAGSAAAIATLQESLLGTVAEATLLEAELRRIVDVLRTEHIPVIVLKGPVLARTVYPEPHLRPFNDIDLNVQSRDVPRSLAALGAAGYQRLDEEPAVRQRPGARSGAVPPFHLQFKGALGEAVVELHTDPLQMGILAICEEDRWVRSQPLPGLPGAWMLSPSDQITQLALHVHKHGYNRLIWLKDLDLILRSDQEIDWDLLASVAEAEGIGAAVWCALRMAEYVLQTPVPRAELARLRPALLLRGLYSVLWPRRRVTGLKSRMRRHVVQFEAAASLRGTLPSLILLGRRRLRAKALIEAILVSR